MQSEKSNPVLTHPLEIRLMRYALAGGALLAAPAAHATIVYSGPLDTVADAGQNIDVSFNPLASGVTNFTIEVSTTQIDVTGILSSVFFDIGPLAAGTPITVADVTSNPLLVLVNKLNFATHVGPWVGVSDPAYLAVKFSVSSQQYLGWVELQLNESTPSATLLGYAYNDQPLASITVGDTGTPEPGSLTLFALGAAGLLALRRRRAA